MAAGVVDGAIIVDTGIRNNKAKVGAREFVNMVDRLTQTVNKAGQQMAGSTSNYVQAMNRARAAAKGMTGDQAAIAKEILQTASAIKKLEERQELARRKFEESRDAAIGKATSDFEKNTEGMQLLPWEDEAQAAQQ